MAREDLPPYRQVTLSPSSNGGFKASYHWQTYRFFFADGETLDVEAVRDDSDLREAVLTQHYGKRVTDPKQGKIEGVANVTSSEPSRDETPPEQVVRKRPVKRSSSKPPS